MTQLVNTNADDPLGYPAFYRLTYGKTWGKFTTADEMNDALGTMRGRLDGSALVQRQNDPRVAGDEAAAVIDVATKPAAAGKIVDDLLDVADVPWWRALLISLDKVERIAQSQSTSPADREQAKKKAADEREADNPVQQIVRAGQTIGVVFIVLLIVAGLYLLLRAKKELAV